MFREKGRLNYTFMPEKEILTFATANAHKGELFRYPNGQTPLKRSQIVVYQEVDPKRDRLESQLRDAGYKIAITETDLAIAVRNDFEVGKTRVFQLEKGRWTGPDHVMIAAEVSTPDGHDLVVADAHPDIPLRVTARYFQLRAMSEAFEDPFFDGDVILGEDANHYPRPGRGDKRFREKAGLKPVEINEPTFRLDESRHAWLGKLGFPDGEMDAVLIKGKGIKDVSSRVIKIRSDHGAVEADLELTNS